MNINEYEINDIENQLNNPFVTVSDLSCGFLNKFRSLSNTGLYISGMNKLNTQIFSLAQSIEILKRIIRVQTDEIFKSEEFLAAQVDSIALPNISYVSDTGQSIDIDNITLGKEDGKSVTGGVLASINLSTNFTDVLTGELKNINNNESGLFNTFPSKEETFSDINKVTLGSINGNKISSLQRPEFSQDISSVLLKDISNGNVEQVIDNLKYTDAEKVNIKNLNDKEDTIVIDA